MKKALAMLMALVLVAGSASVFAAAKATNKGKVLTIYVWNDEFQARFNF